MARIFAHIATLVNTVRAVAAPVVANQFVDYADTPAGADDPVQGVAKTDAATGEALAVIAIGVVEMKAATAIGKGVKVYSDANGNPTAAGANNPVGRALKAAANPGDTVTILLNPR